MRGPILDQINVVVADMDASVAFYRLLGLEIPDTMPEFQAHHRSAVLPGGVDFDLDSVEFAKRWNPGWPGGSGGNTGVINFRVEGRDEVDEFHRRLVAAGHPRQHEPHDAFWGARYAIVADPDGNSIGIMSAQDPSMRARPLPPE